MSKVYVKQVIRSSCKSPATFAANLLIWKEITFSDLREHCNEDSYKIALDLKKVLINNGCIEPKSKRWVKTKKFIQILESLA